MKFGLMGDNIDDKIVSITKKRTNLVTYTVTKDPEDVTRSIRNA